SGVRAAEEGAIKWLNRGSRSASAEKREVVVTASGDLDNVGDIRRDRGIGSAAEIVAPGDEGAVSAEGGAVRIARGNGDDVIHVGRLRQLRSSPLDESAIRAEHQAVVVSGGHG